MSEATQDWLLPQGSRPPLIGELERRIELALATARASEAAVMTVGAAALDAAEQARRAAELAERASLVATQPRPAVAVVEPSPEDSSRPASAAKGPAASEGRGDLGEFSARADRLVARLRQLQRIPLAEPAANDAAAR